MKGEAISINVNDLEKTQSQVTKTKQNKTWYWIRCGQEN